MRLALWGARADLGGLAGMTHDFFRHMRPERTMVIDLGPAGRGPSHNDRYPDAEIQYGYNDAIAESTVRRFLDGIDVVYLAETAYYEPFCAIAREMGIRTCLHSMPELYRAGDAQPDVIWLPTTWRRDVVAHPDVRIMPVPVDRDIFKDRGGKHPVGTFLHMGAPAFHDRNGTQTVVEALVHVRRPVRVIFATAERPPPIRNRHGVRVEVDWRPGAFTDRADAYPADAEALLMPRRYAGLSLPFQEAAALGWPVVASDLDPQNQWLPACTLAPASPKRSVAMVGGDFQVFDADAGRVARIMDLLGSDQATVDAARAACRARAEMLDWVEWAPRYWDAFAEIVEQAPASL